MRLSVKNMLRSILLKALTKSKFLRFLLSKTFGNFNIKNIYFKKALNLIARIDYEHRQLIKPEIKQDISVLIENHVGYREDSLYIFNIYGTGDAYLLGMLIRNYIESVRKIKPSKVYTFGKKSNYLILCMFDTEINHIEIGDIWDLKTIFDGYVSNPLESNIVVPHVRHITGCKGLDELSQYLGFSDMHLMSYLLSYSLYLIPSRPQLREGVLLNDIVEKNSVLIIPESNSLPSIESNFWIRLIDKLLASGKNVYLNKNSFLKIDQSEKLINFDLDVDLLMSVSDKFDAVIGAQCGLTNILIDVLKNNNVVMINNKFDLIKEFSDSLSVKNMWPFFSPEKFIYPNKRVLTLTYESNSELFLSKIMDYLDTFEAENLSSKNIQYHPLAVSLGEILDRVSILRIKTELFEGGKKLDSVHELHALMDSVGFTSFDYKLNEFAEELYALNKEAWTINDSFYNFNGNVNDATDEELMIFGRLILECQNINKKRISVKNKINELYDKNSFFERKSFN